MPLAPQLGITAGIPIPMRCILASTTTGCSSSSVLRLGLYIYKWSRLAYPTYCELIVPMGNGVLVYY